MDVQQTPNLDELVENYNDNDVKQYLYDYNKWIENQLTNGGLIFSPEDYFGIWQGRV